MRLEILSRLPAGRRHPTPLLFIHGMQHAAWCWDVHFLDYFAGRGYAAHAVDLRGHGNSEGLERLRWTRIDDFVQDVASTVEQLPRPPILIGHSMGGFIIQKYLEEHTVPGAVLLSSPPPSGLLPTALRIARRHPVVFARVNATFSLMPVIATNALAREAYFSPDFPDDELEGYRRQMQEESYRAFLDMVALALPRPRRGETRMLVLGVARDNMLSAAQIAATAQAYGADYEIIAGVAHNSMLERRWQSVADRILEWLNSIDLDAQESSEPAAGSVRTDDAGYGRQSACAR